MVGADAERGAPVAPGRLFRDVSAVVLGERRLRQPPVAAGAFVGLGYSEGEHPLLLLDVPFGFAAGDRDGLAVAFLGPRDRLGLPPVEPLEADTERAGRGDLGSQLTGLVDPLD